MSNQQNIKKENYEHVIVGYVSLSGRNGNRRFANGHFVNMGIE